LELRKQVPTKWNHEMVSLTMIDSILEYLGLQIDLDNLDQPLKQIGDGIDATSIRFFPAEDKANQEMDMDLDSILTSRDFVFIKECIWGGPLPEIGGQGFVGRPMMEKEWLYDIVNNRHSGLDVDKIDYYARDQRHAFRAAGEIDNVMIEEAVVAWGACTRPDTCLRCQSGRSHHGKHLMICYPEKSVQAVVGFFKTRFHLFTHIYHHKTCAAAAHMICDIFCLADPYFRIPPNIDGEKSMCAGMKKLPADGLPISCAMLDPHTYQSLDDEVITVIRMSTDPKLRPARQLIRRLSRDLYKCVVKENVSRDSNLWHLSSEEIKKAILGVGGKHDQVNGSLIQLNEDDIIVDKCETHHGRKDKSPLESMRFVDRNNLSKISESIDKLPEAQKIDENRYLATLPRMWQENSIRIFCRDSSPSKVDLVKHTFKAMVSQLESAKQTAAALVHGESVDDMEEEAALPLLSQESLDSDVECNTHDEDEDEEVPDRNLQQSPIYRGGIRMCPVTPLKKKTENNREPPSAST